VSEATGAFLMQQQGRGVLVLGPAGSFHFDSDYSPGTENADFFGAGPSYEYLFRLFVLADRALVVVSRIEEHYGRSSTDTLYESRDGGRSFEVRPLEPAPEGPAQQFLYVT